MKKRKAKALRQMAGMLPASIIFRNHSESGKLWKLHQLKDDGLEIANLPKITNENRDQIFTIKSRLPEELNHYKRLKKAYLNKGTDGVKEYILWVEQHNRRTAKTLKDVEQVDPNLVRIAKMKVGDFWKSLIIFLYSFFMTRKTS